MNAPLSDSLLRELQSIDACTLANAIETLHVRLKNEGFADRRLNCLFPQRAPVVGYAVTLRIRGASPPTGNVPYSDRTDWWDYVLSVPAPRFVVVQDLSSQPGLGSLLGEVHVNLLQVLGCVAAATNGTVRDLPAVEKTGFQLFAEGLSVSHAYVHIVDFGGAVEVGGLKIASGELLHGDRHGIQSIPIEQAAALPALAADLTRREQALLILCRTPGLSLDALRAAVASPPS